AATWSGRPPLSAAWRAGFWPRPADTTLPMMHSSTIVGSMPARRTASRTTPAPSCVAANDFSAPRNLPVRVRTADTITDSRTTNLDLLDPARAEECLEPPQDDARRPHDLTRPLRTGGLDDQHALLELHRRHALQRLPDGAAPGEIHLAVGQRRGAKNLDDGSRDRALERLHVFDLIIRTCA